MIPHGAQPCLANDLATPAVSVDEVIQKSGFAGKGPLMWGCGDGMEPTSLICGQVSFASDQGALLVKSLPPFIHIKHTETLNYGWLADAMKFTAYEANWWQPGSNATNARELPAAS